MRRVVISGPETRKLQRFLKAEKKNGLVDFKFTTQTMLEAADGTLNTKAWLRRVRRDHRRKGITVESLAREINNMLAAPTVPDLELL